MRPVLQGLQTNKSQESVSQASVALCGQRDCCFRAHHLPPHETQRVPQEEAPSQRQNSQSDKREQHIPKHREQVESGDQSVLRLEWQQRACGAWQAVSRQSQGKGSQVYRELKRVE